MYLLKGFTLWWFYCTYIYHRLHSESGRFWRFKIWFNPPFLYKCLYQVRVITVFTVFRLLTDFVCLYTYEFWLSLCKIVRSSVILLLPLSTIIVLRFLLKQISHYIFLLEGFHWTHVTAHVFPIILPVMASS